MSSFDNLVEISGSPIYKIISHFIETKEINEENIDEIIFQGYKFFRYYNNNYRPIYHLERFLYYICTKLHDNSNCK